MSKYSKSPPREGKTFPIGGTFCATESRRNPDHVWLGQARATIVAVDVISGEVIAAHRDIDRRGGVSTPGKPEDRAITCMADRGDGALIYSTKSGISLVAIDGGVPIDLPRNAHLLEVEKLFAVGPAIFAQGLARDGRGGVGLAPGVVGWDTAFAQPRPLNTPDGHLVNDIVFDSAKTKAFGVFSPTPHSLSVGVWDVTPRGLAWSSSLPGGLPIPALAVVPSPNDAVDWDPPAASIGLSAGKIVVFRQTANGPAVAVIDPSSFATSVVQLKETDGSTPSVWRFTPLAEVLHAFVSTGATLRVASLETGNISPVVLDGDQVRVFDPLETRDAMRPFPYGDGFIAPFRKDLVVQPSVFHPLHGMAGLEDLRRSHEVAMHPESRGSIVLSERGRRAIDIDI